MKSSDYYAIEHIMRHFDFEKVWRIMVMLNWKWATNDGMSMKIPSVEYITETALGLLKKLDALEAREVGTGGLVASRKKPDGRWEYALAFEAVKSEYWE